MDGRDGSPGRGGHARRGWLGLVGREGMGWGYLSGCG